MKYCEEFWGGSRERVQGCTDPSPEMKLSSSYSLLKFFTLPVSDVIPWRCTPPMKNPGYAPGIHDGDLVMVLTVSELCYRIKKSKIV